MEQLARQFGVEVCSYDVMSSPDVVKAWQKKGRRKGVREEKVGEEKVSGAKLAVCVAMLAGDG